MAQDLRKELNPVNPDRLEQQRVPHPDFGRFIESVGGAAIDAARSTVLRGAERGLANERDAIIGELGATENLDAIAGADGGMGGESPIRTLDIGARTGERQEEISTASESAPVKEFANRMLSLQRAVKQGGIDSDAAQIRLEKALRSYMSKYPGLAPELQAVGERVFGRNVLGAELDVALKARKAQIATAQASIKDYEDFATKIGMNMARPRDTTFYQDVFKMGQILEDKVLEDARYSRQQHVVTEDKQGQEVHIAKSIAPELILATRRGTEILGPLLGMSDTERAAFLKTNGERLRDTFSQDKANLISKYQKDHPRLSGEEVRMALKPVLDTYDRYGSMASGEGRLADLKGFNELTLESAKSSLYSRPGYAVVTTLMKDIGASGSLASFFGQGAQRQAADQAMAGLADVFADVSKDLNKGKFTPGGPGIADRIALSDNPEETGTNVIKSVEAGLKSLEKSSDPAQIEAVKQTVLSFAKRAGLDQNQALPPDVTARLEQVLSHPAMKAVIDKMDESERNYLREAFGNSTYAASRATSIARRVAATITEGFLDGKAQLPFTSKGQSGVFGNNNFVRGTEFLSAPKLLPNGELQFGVKSDAELNKIQGLSPEGRKALVPAARRYAIRLNRTAAQEWNGLVRMLAAMEGTTDTAGVARKYYPILAKSMGVEVDSSELVPTP